jgi:hypothetical protein
MIQVPFKVVALIGALSCLVASGAMLKEPKQAPIVVAATPELKQVAADEPVPQVLPQAPGPLLPCCPGKPIPGILKVSVQNDPVVAGKNPGGNITFLVAYKGNINLVHQWEGFPQPYCRFLVVATSLDLFDSQQALPQGVNPPSSGMQIYVQYDQDFLPPYVFVNSPLIAYSGAGGGLSAAHSLQLESCSPFVAFQRTASGPAVVISE